MLFRQYKERRDRMVGSRAITDVWKVLVHTAPWLAPIVLPAGQSARLRLIEVR